MGERIEVAKVGELASGDIKLVEANGEMIVLLNVGGVLQFGWKVCLEPRT